MSSYDEKRREEAMRFAYQEAEKRYGETLMIDTDERVLYMVAVNYHDKMSRNQTPSLRQGVIASVILGISLALLIGIPLYISLSITNLLSCN